MNGCGPECVRGFPRCQANRRWIVPHNELARRATMPQAQAMEKRRDYLTLLALRLRVGLGLWFVWSGYQLVFISGLTHFTQAVGNYKMVGAPWDAVIAYILPWMQIVTGACLALGRPRRGAILAGCGLVTTFAVAIGWAWYHKLNIACGCHGGDEPIQYWWKVLEFYVYYEAFVFLWWIEARSSKL